MVFSSGQPLNRLKAEEMDKDYSPQPPKAAYSLFARQLYNPVFDLSQGKDQNFYKIIAQTTKEGASAPSFYLYCYISIFIVIWGIFVAFVLQFYNHSVESATPQLFEPSRFAEPFNECRADCVVEHNEQSTVPSRIKSVISVTP